MALHGAQPCTACLHAGSVLGGQRACQHVDAALVCHSARGALVLRPRIGVSNALVDTGHPACPCRVPHASPFPPLSRPSLRHSCPAHACSSNARGSPRSQVHGAGAALERGVPGVRRVGGGRHGVPDAQRLPALRRPPQPRPPRALPRLVRAWRLFGACLQGRLCAECVRVACCAASVLRSR